MNFRGPIGNGASQPAAAAAWRLASCWWICIQQVHGCVPATAVLLLFETDTATAMLEDDLPANRGNRLIGVSRSFWQGKPCNGSQPSGPPTDT